MSKNIMLFCGNLSNGGAERSMVRLADALKENNNVFIVVTNANSRDYFTDVPVIEINEFNKKFSRIKGIFKLRRFKKEHKIDTSISCMTAFNFYNSVSKYRDKTIITITNHMSSKKEGFFLDIFKRITAKLCDVIVCCGDSVGIDHIKNFGAKPSKTRVIYNYCDANEIEGALNKDNVPKTSGDYFVTMARLTPHKGIQHVICAMSKVIKDQPEAKLLVLGRGPYKSELVKLSKKLRLSKNIIFMDFISNPYIYLKESKGFILASDYEGLPNAVIEAMMCGAPIIATDVPGGSKEMLLEDTFYDNNPIDDIILGEYGILVPGFIDGCVEKNEKILANAMIKLLDDSKMYKHYAQKSVERAKKYSKEEIIKDWLEII